MKLQCCIIVIFCIYHILFLFSLFFCNFLALCAPLKLFPSNLQLDVDHLKLQSDGYIIKKVLFS